MDQPPPGHPYPAEIAAERAGWNELVDLVRSLTAEECLERPGLRRRSRRSAGSRPIGRLARGGGRQRAGGAGAPTLVG